MRNISSAVLSLAAMALSSLTTYLSFFDARYTLTSAVADVKGDTNRGSGRRDGKWTVNFRFYAEPTVILSNRGTRALVVSDVDLVESQDVESCKVADDAKRHNFTMRNEDGTRYNLVEPFIVEPGTVMPVTLSAALNELNLEGVTGQAPDMSSLAPRKTLWCMEWTIYDPNGKRHMNMMPGVVSDIFFEIPEGEDIPDQTYKLDFPKGAVQLLSRGIF